MKGDFSRILFGARVRLELDGALLLDAACSEERASHAGNFAFLEMDDIMSAGGEEHDRRMEFVAAKVQFGKDVWLQDTPEGALFNGRRWWQDANFNVWYSMDEFVRDRVSQVDLRKPKEMNSATAENAKEPVEVEIDTPDVAIACRSCLPEGLEWGDVLTRDTYSIKTGERIVF